MTAMSTTSTTSPDLDPRLDVYVSARRSLRSHLTTTFRHVSVNAKVVDVAVVEAAVDSVATVRVASVVTVRVASGVTAREDVVVVRAVVVEDVAVVKVVVTSVAVRTVAVADVVVHRNLDPTSPTSPPSPASALKRIEREAAHSNNEMARFVTRDNLSEC